MENKDDAKAVPRPEETQDQEGGPLTSAAQAVGTVIGKVSSSLGIAKAVVSEPRSQSPAGARAANLPPRKGAPKSTKKTATKKKAAKKTAIKKAGYKKSTPPKAGKKR